MKYNILGENYTPKFRLPFETKFESGDLVPLDLSVHNRKLADASPETLEGLQKYIDGFIRKSGGKGAYGGYDEKRAIYRRSAVFLEDDDYRSIHLGIDFWLPAGTVVVAPLPGFIHSFADNDASGDYGPTIVLKHPIGNQVIHSLYGHLSRTSLVGLEKGQLIRRGQQVGTLGIPDENKDWPPHLHFQLIQDMEGKIGDYPGVCYEKEKEKYLVNCPDPRIFFGDGWLA